ncbi:hypothetical protein FYJ84_07165 [Veillonellaceae bacterium WCA-693-APC-5D-A]|uniref:Uncharacterized protein n=1 Tax=Anaerovibrio slackiae TaxID=2652309 RepID=A0A6I2UGS0_9FIRM|nr:hypothetical protein [Anaerovibrio slackiae]MSU08760.1 hypothetical protein [Anaerovibrio slackiae]
MTTEILGFIIIAGAVIVLVARHQLSRAEDDPEVLEAATGRLRYELEQSADEIISRMTEHVDRLERLLREADYKAEVLQERIRQLEALQGAQGMHGMEAGAAYQPLSGAERQGVDYLTVRAAADASAANVNASAGAASVREPGGYGMPSMSESDRRAWELIREASMELEAQYEAQSNAMQSAQQSDALQQAVDIQTGNLDSYVSGSSYAAETADELGYAYDEEKGLDTEAAARQARQMLAQGFEVDDIARATGLGIGAVQLIRQMEARQAVNREKEG